MSVRCEYIGGPRDGDLVTVVPLQLGTRICLRDGQYLVASKRDALVALWCPKYEDVDAIDPNEGEEWKQR